MIAFRTYTGDRTGNGDFWKLHRFLAASGNRAYTYARFDWMMTNWDYLEDAYLNRIGMWEENGRIVGAALYDHSLDVVYPVVLPGYETVYPDMLRYMKANMVRETRPELLVYAGDSDRALRQTLESGGMCPTEERETVRAFDLTREIPKPVLPDGFRLTALDTSRDYRRYLYCLFRGFGHEENGERFTFTERSLADCVAAYTRPWVDLSLKISVADRNGDFVTHAGLWYDRSARIALVEPVCTVPDCRGMGLARAALLEGLRRVRALGAETAVVGSDQPFYRALGFTPCCTGTLWKPVDSPAAQGCRMRMENHTTISEREEEIWQMYCSP